MIYMVLTGIEGPIPVSSDESTVVLQDLPNVLSETQKRSLTEQIPQYETLSEEWMISSFTIAKVFVHRLCS